GDGTWTAGEPFDDANGAIPDVYEPCPLPWNLDPAPPSGFTGGPFQIFRQPVPSPSGSLELPESVVIDLNFSGTETWPFHPRDFVSAPASPYVGSPIEVYSLSPMFTFNPSGDIDRVWCNWRITSNATV